MKNRIYNILLVALAGFIVLYYSQKPEYNWDMIAYMGIVTEYSEPDMQKMHDEVYTSLQNETPAEIYNGLTADIEDRRDCLLAAAAFYDELEYFRVKPLYTGFVYALHKTGIPLVKATLIPSLIASFLLLIVLYALLSLYVQNPFALILTVILGLYEPFREITALSSPDAMSNLFIMLSLYLVAKQYKGIWLPVVLFFSVVSRVDNFIFAGVVSYFVYLQGKRNVLLLSGVIGAIGLAGVILIPVLMGDTPDWFMKFAYVASIGDYVQHWRDVFFLFRHSVYDMLVIAISIFLLIKTHGLAKKMTLIVLISVAVHMLLFPSLQERFLVAYEFTLVTMLAWYVIAKYRILPAQKLAV
ncbi:MAG: hypothetical protein KDC07_02685 [Chitinophagaceae bacterium]|nr:hypothetical protein [Chitinophagaceae bacterium]MCB9044770.1 hypothetical protein [Chitinophagales bacterium]